MITYKLNNKLKYFLKGWFKVLGYIFILFLIATFCSFVGMALVPLIYEFNSPVYGERYAQWASYVISILLFYMIKKAVLNET